jgi:hypothetical protein
MASAGNEDESGIVHREFDTDGENPSVDVASVIAELEDREVTSLSPMYDCVDDMIDELFSNPPAAEAQMQVEFTYEGYRVTINQDGSATFLKITE